MAAPKTDCADSYITSLPSLPSLPILALADPLIHTPHLIGSALLVLPTDPLLPEVAAAQAADPTLSAHIHHLQRGPGGGSNPALPTGSPSGRSADQLYTLQGGLLYC